jgi:hypothetical protein
MSLPASTHSQLINKFLIKLSGISSTLLVHRQCWWHWLRTSAATLYDILRGFNYRNNFPIPSLLFPFTPSSSQVSTSVTEPSRWRWQNYCVACTLKHSTGNIPRWLLTAPHGHHHLPPPPCTPPLIATAFFPFMWCDKSRLCVMGGKEVW